MHSRRCSPRALLLGALLLPGLVVSAGLAVPAGAEPAPQPVTEELTPEGDLGSWSVEQSGAETWQVSWRSPERLPVTSDRPTIVTDPTAPPPTQPGATPVEVGVPTVADDGRTVQAVVVSSVAPDPARLDVVLSGQTLEDPAALDGGAGSARWTEPTRSVLPADPAEPGALETLTEDYELDGIDVTGLAEKVEMVGHVVRPTVASADHPLVVFLHGRHGYCYQPAKNRLTWDWPCRGTQEPVPSQLGYDYVQQTLASQGYVTVSVAANGINAQDGALDDGGAAARSSLVQAHLDRWAEWTADGTKKADLSEVVLIGHSRGGEGVARASLDIPLGADYHVAGQVLLAPTDFSRQTSPYVPTVTVLPYCDGDVSDLQGQAYTDVSRDLVAGDPSLRSSVLVIGANHNFFNTEWTPGRSAAPSDDDWWSRTGVCGPGADTRLSASEQRRVGRAYIAGAVRLYASGEDVFRPMYDGSAVRVPSTGDAVVLSHALGGGRELRRPGIDAGLTDPSGATSQLCRGVTGFDTRPRQCGRFAEGFQATPHWPSTEPETPNAPAFEMTWLEGGAVAGLSFGTPVDLTGMASLDLRTVVDTKLGDVRLEVRVTDQDGGTAQVEPVTDGGVLPALPRGPQWFPGKYWAQDLRVDPADLSGVDISRVATVELVGLSDRGRVWVLDAAATPAALPPVPAKRVPLVDLGNVRVEEGDGPRTAEVPYTVTGVVDRPAQFRVYALDYFQSERRRIDVAVTPGSTSGTVSWDYTGNTRDSRGRTIHSLTGYGIDNVIVRDYQGRVVIRDDDPAPQLTLRRAARATVEGKAATWELRLSEPVDYELGVALTAVKGKSAAAPVRLDDVGRRWLRKWVYAPSGKNVALHVANTSFSKVLRPGRSSVLFRVPIRQDTRLEKRESLTMVAKAPPVDRRSGPVTVFVKRGR